MGGRSEYFLAKICSHSCNRASAPWLFAQGPHSLCLAWEELLPLRPSFGGLIPVLIAEVSDSSWVQLESNAIQLGGARGGGETEEDMWASRGLASLSRQLGHLLKVWLQAQEGRKGRGDSQPVGNLRFLWSPWAWRRLPGCQHTLLHGCGSRV